MRSCCNPALLLQLLLALSLYVSIVTSDDGTYGNEPGVDIPAQSTGCGCGGGKASDLVDTVVDPVVDTNVIDDVLRSSHEHPTVDDGEFDEAMISDDQLQDYDEKFENSDDQLQDSDEKPQDSDEKPQDSDDQLQEIEDSDAYVEVENDEYKNVKSELGNAGEQPLVSADDATNRAMAKLKDRAAVTIKSKYALADQPRTNQMVSVDAGIFTMGTDKVEKSTAMDGEGPARSVNLDTRYYIDRHATSNAEFARFILDTGYVTEAEVFGNSFVLDAFLSTSVRSKISQAVAAAPWWLPVNNTDWMHPFGPDSDIISSLDHPVLHVSWNDALKFCKWADKRLPTEAEWEKACRDGKKDKRFPWGDKMMPKKEHRMNVWQGNFPKQNLEKDGFARTCPVTQYKSQNSLGLKNMVGNVWEWVNDWWSVKHIKGLQVNPKGPSTGTDRTRKGGSHQCIKNTCYRYRCAARSQNTPDSSASNLGFRCAADQLPDNVKLYKQDKSHDEL